MRLFFRIFFVVTLTLLADLIYGQEGSFQDFLSDSSMAHASASILFRDIETGETIIGYNSEKSLTPASVMKLITSGIALELLGPQYQFSTTLGYTGSLNKRSGKLRGDIIITGGGDPTLGSENFSEYDKDFTGIWVSDLKKLGIRSVTGRVMADDSYYDFLPVPSKWLWEDLGNYYGAGVYGLSGFDNTIEIHLKTGVEKSPVIITGVYPGDYRYDFENRLIASGTTDEGYILAAPYSKSGCLSGSVPVNMDDFILKGSIADPPLLAARILNRKLTETGIKIKVKPSTTRLEKNSISKDVISVSEIKSPPLSEIIKVLNHESVNLYAETLLKELGKKFRNEGSSAAGIDVINDFFISARIPAEGMYIEDGSGLSPKTAINSEELVNFLIYMKKRGKYFNEYFASLPEAGKEGTLKNYFRDPAFETRMHAKSGSMERVRCYAGYFTTKSNRSIAFSILVNNYTGSSQKIIRGTEEIIKTIILYK